MTLADIHCYGGGGGGGGGCRALQGAMYSTEALMLEALVARAKYENGRYQPPKQKRKPKGSNEWVDWF